MLTRLLKSLTPPERSAREDLRKSTAAAVTKQENPMIWQSWKKGFDSWENSTAKYIEVWLKSPLVLGPSGRALGATMKVKAAADKLLTQAIAVLGVATKRDQERGLHALNQLESRLLDLEEKLDLALHKEDDAA